MFGQSARFDWEIKMNQNDGKMIIFIYNLYTTYVHCFFIRWHFLWPALDL